MSEYYIGLMSGTSVDGIDAVLVDFGKEESSASLNEQKSSNSQYNVKSRIVDSISIDFDEELNSCCTVSAQVQTMKLKSGSCKSKAC